jgi:hypothetical protein
MRAQVTSVGLLLVASLAQAATLGIFAGQDSAGAPAAWTAQFGSPPARTEVLAVNTGREACVPTLGLALRAGTAEVVFEGREVGLRDGTWSDPFGPDERHVYRLLGPP